jgi:CubicO group peptidase (beta-lactamase class C family)
MKQIDKQKLSEIVHTRIEADLTAGRLSAAAVSVYQDEKPLLESYFGYENTVRKKPLNQDSSFRLASMTKPITAAAVLREIEKGRLNLFDPVEKFLPAYADRNIAEEQNGNIVIIRKAVNKVRILHLLTHTSGIGSGEIGTLLAERVTAADNIDLRHITDFYAKQPISFEPYTMTQYSATAAFDILARIVELVSGKPFDRYTEEEIFSPLSMTDTTFHPNGEQMARIVEMHTLTDGVPGVCSMSPDCVFENIPMTHFCGGAGLTSTLKDYTRFARMLLGGGILDGQRILEEKTVKSLSIPHIPEAISSGDRWTLGMRVIADENYRRLPVGSFGWSGAYGTHFWVDPQNRLSVVYMKNSKYDGGSGARTAAHMEEDIYSVIMGN